VLQWGLTAKPQPPTSLVQFEGAVSHLVPNWYLGMLTRVPGKQQKVSIGSHLRVQWVVPPMHAVVYETQATTKHTTVTKITIEHTKIFIRHILVEKTKYRRKNSLIKK